MVIENYIKEQFDKMSEKDKKNFILKYAFLIMQQDIAPALTIKGTRIEAIIGREYTQYVYIPATRDLINTFLTSAEQAASGPMDSERIQQLYDQILDPSNY